jgi:haloalkane dehalogenase
MVTEPAAIDRSGWGHLYPFRSHFLAINGLRYHYLDEGQGQPVVMVHGNPTWSFYYRRLVRALSPFFRTVAPDHIGCGLSDKPDPKAYAYRLENRVNDLERLLDHLDFVEKLTLILHDWGGPIGLAAALRRPDRIGRIVVLNTAAFLPPSGKRLPLRLRIVRDFPFFSRPAVLQGNLFVRGALWMAARKRLPADTRAGLAAPYRRPADRIATLMFVQDIPVKPTDPSYAIIEELDRNLHRFSALPVMVCWGEQDFVFDRDYLAEWRRRFPTAEVHTFADAGHYILEDVPEAVVERIMDFLQRHPL